MINKHITKKTGKIGKFKIINAAILKITHKQEREKQLTVEEIGLKKSSKLLDFTELNH